MSGIKEFLMIEFSELAKEQKKEVYNKAFTWKHDHADHVETIAKNEFAIAPSGSDLFKPELWKGIHWQWFIARDWSAVGSHQRTDKR